MYVVYDVLYMLTESKDICIHTITLLEVRETESCAGVLRSVDRVSVRLVINPSVYSGISALGASRLGLSDCASRLG